MKRSHSANMISAMKQGSHYDTIPAMLPQPHSVKNVSPKPESGTPPPLPPPRKPKAHQQSMPESKLSVVRRAQSPQTQAAQPLPIILLENETQNLEDNSDLDFLPNFGLIAVTLHDEIAMELSKHLLESAPSPAPSTTSI